MFSCKTVFVTSEKERNRGREGEGGRQKKGNRDQIQIREDHFKEKDLLQSVLLPLVIGI